MMGGYGVSTWFFVQSLKSVDAIYREEGRKSLVQLRRFPDLICSALRIRKFHELCRCASPRPVNTPRGVML